MVKTKKECQTVTSKDLKSYPEKEKKRWIIMRELVERISGSIDTLLYSISKYEAVNFLFLELSEISFFPNPRKSRSRNWQLH